MGRVIVEKNRSEVWSFNLIRANKASDHAYNKEVTNEKLILQLKSDKNNVYEFYLRRLSSWE